MVTPFVRKEQVTGRGWQLLIALREHGGWLSRAELARRTGKHQLSPHDKLLLQRMVEDDLIEVRERESNTPVGTAFIYHAIPKGDIYERVRTTASEEAGDGEA